MKQYVAMPIAWRNDPDSTADWVARAFDHTAAMPPKQKKK